ncbi:MAG: hypothetical protein R6U31_03835 [bacterium]
MKYEAYWIKPDGEIIPVSTRHIDAIIKNPQAFDMTEAYIKEQFNRFNEPMGREGRARRKIMEQLIRKGFIRVRFKPRQWKWYMECNIIDENVESQVEAWINKICSHKGNNCKKILFQPLNGEGVEYEC